MTCPACDRKTRAQTGVLVRNEPVPEHECGLTECLIERRNLMVHLVNMGDEVVVLIEPGKSACGRSLPWVELAEVESADEAMLVVCANCARVALSWHGPYWPRAVEKYGQQASIEARAKGKV